MGSAILFLFYSLISLAVFLLIANAIISWLVAFDVINTRNPTIGRILGALEAVTEPLLRPIRRILPNMGGVDLSPIIAILLLQALRILVVNTVDLPLRAALH